MSAEPTPELDRASELMRLGKFAQAAELLERFVGQHPGDPQGWFTLGQALGMLDQAGDAEIAFRKAAELRPDWYEARANIASTLVNRQKLREAVPEFVAARKLRSDDPGTNDTFMKVLIALMQRESGKASRPEARFGPLENNPLVSVVIPTQNRLGMLRDALGSVARQTYGNWEAIVVNDGGEDISPVLNALPADVSARIKAFRSMSPQGQANARNRAVQAAQGRIVAFLDDDDFYYPEHLQTLVGGLQESRCDVAYTRAAAVMEKLVAGNRVECEKGLLNDEYGYSRAVLLVFNFIFMNTVGVRKECLLEIGGFDESLACLEDWDLMLRLTGKYAVHEILKVTAEVRFREGVTDSVTTRYRAHAPTREAIYQRYPGREHEFVELARDLLWTMRPAGRA